MGSGFQRAFGAATLCLVISAFAQEDPDTGIIPAQPVQVAPKPAAPIPARLATKVLLLDHVRDIAVGDRGTILRAGPDGAWSHEPSPSSSLLTAAAWDGRTHWAVGHDKTILKHTAGGWELIARNIGEREDLPVRWTFLDMHWFDAKEALIVGSYGLLMRTMDGGATWGQSRINWEGFLSIDDIDEDDFETLPDSDEIHLYRVRQSPKGVLFCVGEAGSILRSTDRGKTWKRGKTVFEGALNDVLVADEKTILAVGILGTLLRSEDGGATFRQVDLKTRSILHALTRAKDGTIWTFGDGGARFKSTDAGVSFTAEPITERVAITGGVPDGGFLLTEKGIRPW